jgi:hypothetical protein
MFIAAPIFPECVAGQAGYILTAAQRAAKCRFVRAQSLSSMSLHDLDPLLERTEHFRGSLRRNRENIADVERKPLELYFAPRALLRGERATQSHTSLGVTRLMSKNRKSVPGLDTAGLIETRKGPLCTICLPSLASEALARA